METQIYAHARVLDLAAISNSILDWFYMQNSYNDSFLEECMNALKQENEILLDAMGGVRKGRFTDEMQRVDQKIMQYFVALKFFVKGNMHLADKQIVASANIVWETISAIGRNAHRKGHIRKIHDLLLIVDRLLEAKMLPVVKTLKGVEESAIILKAACNQLNDLFRQSIREKVSRKDRVQPTAQAKKLQARLNNDLLPYLGIMAKVDPGKYSKFSHFVDCEVKEINTKIKARRTRWANKAKKNEAE